MAFKAKVSQKTWDEIQAQYEAGVPIAQISRDFKLSRSGITKRADHKGWVRGSAEQDVNERTIEIVNGVSKSTNVTTRDTILDDIALARAELILNHRREWKEVEAIGKEVLRCLDDPDYRPKFWDDWKVVEWDYQKKDAQGRPTPQRSEYRPFDQDARDKRLRTLQTTYKTKAEALITKQEGERRAYGFDYKMQLEEQGKKDDGYEKRVERAKALIERLEQKARSKPMPSSQPGNLPA